MKTTFSFIFLLVSVTCFSQASLRPFPQHAKYAEGVIIPGHISQQELDDSTYSFYTRWKQRYVKKSKCTDGSYIWSENAEKDNQCVSEGQGYGMIIVALMSGSKRSEQELFDELYIYYKQHPSSRNNYLMSWAQTNDCKTFEESSATDGDIDIAYSLLLADAQWTSKGKINYREETIKIITAIREQDINQKFFNVLESNSIEHDSPDYFDMRSSDFIPAELRSFSHIDSSNIWKKVIDSNYSLFYFLQNSFSKDAGLVPDFIQHINTKPRPADMFYLESKYDGSYNYNACRVPWRIATDYILHGDMRARQFVQPINAWIRTTTSDDPDNISAGYSLGGIDMKTRNFEALSFIAPFGISAMVDSKNGPWLNKLWDYIIHFKLSDFDYYDNSIKMLSLIILSHNYWAP